jgi:hypothetical protein
VVVALVETAVVDTELVELVVIDVEVVVGGCW